LGKTYILIAEHPPFFFIKDEIWRNVAFKATCSAVKDGLRRKKKNEAEFVGLRTRERHIISIQALAGTAGVAKTWLHRAPSELNKIVILKKTPT
jgi:hypothetical protein